jgi:hypothetical protein
MNTGRFIGAAAGVWIVRVLLNGAFYGKVVGPRLAQMASAHPGIFKQGIAGYVVTDLIFALAFAFLFAKVGSALGGGMKAGVALGIIVAILSPGLGALYNFFSFTFASVSLTSMEVIFQIIAHAIEGAVAGAIYKNSPA